jgi:hypothetical protein
MYMTMTTNGRATDGDIQEFELDRLSEEIRISKQTLVRWSDRGIIDASLHWGISNKNEELRLIRVSPSSVQFLKAFAQEYRDDTVSRTEARRILKLIDRSQVQKLLRHGQLQSKKVEDETRVVVGSIEDHLMANEAD